MDILPAPEQGQLVRLRNRFYLVQDVVPYQLQADVSVFHRVTLESLDDDQLGQSLDVIWEREIAPTLRETISLPAPDRWDPVTRFQAFIHAITWSTSSVIEGPALYAPFRGAIELEDYQLEPVARALIMPRVNLLIADDVGLGKTIEAGLVLQELLARQRVRRVLVVCPASLQRQWKDEMEEKFRLEFRLIDRDEVQRLRREYGVHVNPWNSFPRLITSMDFLKREQPKSQFLASLAQRDGRSPLRDWDLLILDEAHNVAPAGRRAYIRDSDRTRMMADLVNHFEHRLFLTATPHNGYTESFTALLELLDPLRFSRGLQVERMQVAAVMVRRLKDDIRDALGNRKFAQRKVEPIWVTLTTDERRQHDLLRQYTESRLARVEWVESLPIRFALTMLKKRLLSSPLAFHESINTHTRTLGQAVTVEESAPDPDLARRLQERADEDWDDDAQKVQYEDDALEEATRLFAELTAQERAWLGEMEKTAGRLRQSPDTKASALINWIESHLQSGGRWNRERLIIFTEYKHTLEYLETLLKAQGWGERLLTLIGGMGLTEREAIKAAFQVSPDENPVRILLATDAASEGLNLQNHCRYLIHWEIPWNPNRMEQRNGRIDRHGQRAKEVFCRHFVYREHEDTEFLQTVVEKVQTMRTDLGSIGEVIAAQVEEAMLGRRRELDLPDRRLKLVKEEVKADVLTEQAVETLRQKRLLAQHQLGLYPDNLRLVLDEALKLQGHPGLEPIAEGDLAGKAYRLTRLPPAWHDADQAIRDRKGRLLALVFDHAYAKDRKDVTIVHLNHPLMRRAMGVFRTNLWSEGLRGDGELSRVAYRVLPDYLLPAPIVVAFGRVVATSTLSQKLHEAVITVGAEIRQRALAPLDPALLEKLLNERGESPPLPASVAGQLRALFPAHRKQLEKMLADREKEEEKRLMALLKEKVTDETKAVLALMWERIKELEKRLAEREKERAGYQLSLLDEAAQFDEDTGWLERKLGHLRGELDIEPEHIKRRYTLRGVRVFPLGVLYLLPTGIIAV